VNSNNPTISVIMNCYNAEEFLEEAIKSVYSQTFEDWEIIFWDNASQDRSSEIANSFDNNLRFFSSQKTTVLGEARNNATKEARGKYLAFLDCDDLWLKHKLDKQIEVFKKDEGLGLVYGRCELISDNKFAGHFPKSDDPLYEGYIFKSLCRNNFIPFVSAMVDREKFFSCGGFPRNFKHSTDYFLFLNIARKYRVKSVTEVLCRYRLHEANITNTHRVIAAKESIEAVSSFLPDKDAKLGLKFQELNLAVAYFKERKYILSLKVIRGANLWGLFFKRIFKIFIN